MSKLILTNTRLWVGGADLTGSANKVELSTEIEAKDTTNYGSAGWKESIGGLASSTIKAGGQWEAGNASYVDDQIWSQLAAVGAWSCSPAVGAVGDVAYLTKMLTGQYTFLGDVGEVAPWQADAMSSWPVARGAVVHPSGTARTSTGSGSAVQLGTVATGKRMYANLHVLSASGTTPSITATVQSDDNSGFSSSTTRLTFTAATDRGGQSLRTDGTAITDDWWRVGWTISGTGPSFLFVATLGIA